MKKVNLFICHNPFHVYISQQICSTKFNQDNFENWIIAPIKITPKGNINFIVTETGLLKKIFAILKVRRRIDTLISIYKDKLSVFLPHVDGVLSNYIFKSRYVRSNNVKINLYYEGIVMLDDKRMSRKFPRFIAQKRLLSLFAFNWFVKEPDILPLNSPHINSVYTPYPKKTPTYSDRIIEIDFIRETINQSVGSALIVGVDAGESLFESYKELIHFLKNTNLKKYYFKPHYADRSKIFEQVAEIEALNYNLIQDGRCIEELIGNLPVEIVICSHLSSALLNLKLIYKNSLRVILIPHSKTIEALGDDNLAFAKELGIEIITPQ